MTKKAQDTLSFGLQSHHAFFSNTRIGYVLLFIGYHVRR